LGSWPSGSRPQALAMAEATLRLRRLAYPVTVLGPGRRLALWVAGCGLGCPGCISPELHDPASGRALPVSRVLSRILGLEGLDGITLTGGEPFEQPVALADLLEALARGRPGWDVLAYSGFTLSQLRRRGAEAARLLGRCDVLVAGPYRAGVPLRHPLAGSGNQRVHSLSPRGRALRRRCEGLPSERANLGAGRAGGDLLIGILSPAVRRRLHRALGLTPGEIGHG
jgi:anaerobic ribonucleoside-triphosphate reductase activating protein